MLGCAAAPTGELAPREPALPPATHGALDPARTLHRIGFGSCLHQERPQPILDAVIAEGFDLFLFLGDNVYGDMARDDDPGALRRAYQRQARSPGLRRLRESTPLLATWDDHDYGRNDAGGGFAGRFEAERLFEAFWEVASDAPSRRRPGVYDAVVVGPPGRRVQLLLLDTRFFRSPLLPTDSPGSPGRERYLPDADPAKTILGEAQWEWLEEQLQAPAELRLLVSSIQVLAEGHGWERWGNLPAERQRLFDLLRSSGAGGVVLLSGDRHRAGIYRHEEALDYPLYEVTSSSLNVPIASAQEEAGPRRLGPTYLRENFGAVSIDWEAGVVDLEVRDLHGETVLWQSLSLARLRP